MSVVSEFRRTWVFWLLAVVFLVAGLWSLLWGFSMSSSDDPAALTAHAERISDLSLIEFVLGEIAAWVCCLRIVSESSRGGLMRRSMLAVLVVALLQVPMVLLAFTVR